MSADHYDVILRGGAVIDGTGRPAFIADVGVLGEYIAQVGGLEAARADLELEVAGLMVAPGFIDVHAHDDAALIAHPDMAPKVTQGVTTVIAGNCGISGAPYLGSSDPRGLLRLIFKSTRAVAASFEDYVRKVIEATPAVNAGFLTGHTTLRTQVMGEDLGRAASRSEMLAMRDLLVSSLRAGALGLSTGLFYPPARAASTEEVIAVAAPLRVYGGIYVTHIRDEADRVIESVQEALEIGRKVGAPVIVSHHKCMGQRNFGRSTQTLSLLEAAALHQTVGLDAYPYTAGSSVLNEELVSMSSRTVLTWCDPFPEHSGRDLRDVTALLGCSLREAVARLQPAGALYFMMDEEDVTRIMQNRNTMIGSDGLPDDQLPHPRLWGTFPRVLGRYVRERKALTLEEAVHRMSGLAADRFGLPARGRVQQGYFADLCVFDADTIVDTATYERPTQAASGIHHVVVNGQLALRSGAQTGVRAGRVLRRTQNVNVDP